MTATSESPGSPGAAARGGSPFRQRNFVLYLSGIGLAQIGAQAMFAAMLFHVFLLSGSTLQVGLVGLSRGVATLVLSPLGGHFADRLDRRRLLQVSQSFTLLVALGLAVVTLTGHVRVVHIVLASLLVSAANTFDNPTRKAIVPALVGPGQLAKAVALMNPTSQLGRLAGPAIGGLIIALWGPGIVYLANAGTFTILVLILGLLKLPPVPPRATKPPFVASIVEGGQFLRQRPLLLHFLGLDLTASLFAAYRVLLPALALDVLDVGAAGYGLLSAAPSAGALLGGLVAYRLAGMSVASGFIVILSTSAMGASAIALGLSRVFVLSLVSAAAFGLFDSIAVAIRHAALLLQTPDELRGRVSALYGMATSGGPALGELNLGWIASMLGASLTLALGGAVPLVYGLLYLVAARTVREYRADEEERV